MWRRWSDSSPIPNLSGKRTIPIVTNGSAHTPHQSTPSWAMALWTGVGNRPALTVQYAIRVLALPEVRLLGLPEHGLRIRRDPLDAVPLQSPSAFDKWVADLLRVHYGSSIHADAPTLGEAVAKRWQGYKRTNVLAPLPF